MKQIRRSDERGHFENSWLKSFHSFSFSDYYDPKHMHFRDLRVINHDYIKEGAGFPTHPHRDMEIMTYVLKGRVAHRDSMGNQTTIEAGEIQVMSAGSGITHSEFNPDPDRVLELLQIWIVPDQGGLKPSYGQRQFTNEEKKNQLKLLVSPTQAEGSLKIHQDVKVFGSYLETGHKLTHIVSEGRYAWLQVAEGKIEVNGEKLKTGDAIAIDSKEKSLEIKAESATDFVLFDLN
jgi:redox-sensitive bicupin YhaK (pirin superfamily)